MEPCLLDLEEMGAFHLIFQQLQQPLQLKHKEHSQAPPQQEPYQGLQDSNQEPPRQEPQVASDVSMEEET